jgi:uncharacterized protein YfdQ (DUF2303 family)
MDPNNTQAAIDAGKAALNLQLRKDMAGMDDVPVGIQTRTSAGGSGLVTEVVVLDDVIKAHDERAERPRRRKGMARLLEQDSFIAHVLRNKTADSVIFAGSQKLTAVYNYNPSNLAREINTHEAPAAWGDHRAVYPAPLSEELIAWEDGQRCGFDQAGLAAFFDERFDDLVDYPGKPEQRIGACSKLDLLGLCEELVLFTSGQFKASRRKDGTKLICTGEERAEGSTRIPERFGIAIPVFVGGEVYPIEARLSLEVKDNKPRFAYKLLRLDTIKREAFAAVRAAVAEETGLPVFAGSPEV